jgi:hypothetical protein
MNETVRLPFRGIRIGKFIITTCTQPTGAPIIDDSFTHDQEKNEYISKTILLTPWKKNKYNEHVSQRALTIGIRRRINV